MSIALKRIGKSFGEKRVLSDFSLTAQRGETVCLFGKSGCGKTTVARIIAGLENDFEGELNLPEKLKISMVFQENRLAPWLTCAENIELCAAREEALAALAALKIDSCAAQYPAQLSGGMARRAAIARAIAYGGDMCILDEPFSGLDRKAVDNACEVIMGRFSGGYILLITHSAYEAAKIADRVVYMAGGKAVKEISFTMPASERTPEDIQKYAESIRNNAI